MMLGNRKSCASFARLFSFRWLALLLFCFGAATASAVTFSVQNGQLLRDGQPFLVKGINVNGPNWVWPRHTARDADLIVNTWKFNTVRVNVRLTSGVQNESLANIVNAFVSRGVVVMLEIHDFTGRYATSSSSPTLNQLRDWWIARANEYKNQPLVWFNIANEPGNVGPAVPQAWYDMHQPIIAAIRATGAQNIIVLDENYWANMSAANSGATIPSANSAALQWGQALQQAHGNLVFAIHTYAEWRDGGAAKIIDFYDRVAARGLPLIVGEWGMQAFEPWESVTSAKHVYNAAKQRPGLGRIAWHWDGGDVNRMTTRTSVPGGEQAGGGRFIDQTDGSRPTNLTWMGELLWDDNHGLPLQVLDNYPTPYNRSGWTATAYGTAAPRQTSLYGGSESVNDPQVPQEVLDGSFGEPGNLSRWLGSANIADGQWLQIDMQQSRSVARVDVSTQPEWTVPAGYRIYVSNSTTNWGSPVATVLNQQGEKRITFPAVSGRYIRIETTNTAAGTTDRPWAVREVNVYAQATGTPADTTAPSVPTGLAASNVTQTSFTLTWNASTDNVGVTGYEVFLGTQPVGTSTGTSFNLTGLTPGTTYAVRVRARDAVPNWSAQSTALNITTAAAPSTGTVYEVEASGVTRVGGSILTRGGVTLWDMPNGTSVGSAEWTITVPSAGSYTLGLRYANGGSTNRPGTFRVNGTDLSPVLTGAPTGSWDTWATEARSVTLVAGTNTIRYSAAGGVDVDHLTVAAAADTTAPSVPTGLAASNVTQTSFTLTWNASTDDVDVTGYEVFLGTQPVGTPTGTSFNVTGLSAGTTYSVRVRARDAVPNWSAQSTALSVTTAVPVTSATYEVEASGVTRVGGSILTRGGVTLWDMPNGTSVGSAEWTISVPSAGSYTLGLRYANGGSTNRPGTFRVNGTDLSPALTGAPTGSWESWTTETRSVPLVAGTNTIRYSAAGGVDVDHLTVTGPTSGSGGTSGGGSGGGDTTAPSPPTGLNATNIGDTSFTLTWSAATDNVGVTGYRVLRDDNPIGTPSGTSFNVTGLTAGTVYAMTVQARDAAGNWSAASTALMVGTTGGTTGYRAPVVPNASANARRVLRYFYDISGNAILSGQGTTRWWYNQPLNYVFNQTGKHPALYGVDIAYLYNASDLQLVTDRSIAQWQAGSIVTWSNHFMQPTEPEVDTMDWEIINEGNYPPEHIDAMLTPGTSEHTVWMQRLDRTAFYLKQLRDAGVPVIWRPFHEMNGNWFWWSWQPRFTEMWVQMFDRFTHHHGLNNLIWLYSPNAPQTGARPVSTYYPGHAYVDMLGIDVYEQYTHQYTQSQYEDILALGQNRPIVIGENGKLPPVATLRQTQPRWTAWLTWSGFEGADGQNSAADYDATYGHNDTITRDEIVLPPAP